MLSVITGERVPRPSYPKKRPSPSAQRRSQLRAKNFRESKGEPVVDAPHQVSDRDSLPPPTFAGQTSSKVAADTAATKAPRDARRDTRTPPRPAKRKRVDRPNAGDSAVECCL